MDQDCFVVNLTCAFLWMQEDEEELDVENVIANGLAFTGDDMWGFAQRLFC